MLHAIIINLGNIITQGMILSTIFMGEGVAIVPWLTAPCSLYAADVPAVTNLCTVLHLMPIVSNDRG